ncbi:MAG: hypothetical protein H6843_15100 [Rhodospirillaceae bacterium]|nr:hypothetical protein [Rhodospirillaceae bacterium]
MSMLYRHTQRARILMWINSLTFAVVLAVALVVNTTTGWIVLAVAAAFELTIGYLFSSLTVEVTRETLSWHFGPGVIRKSLPRSEIAAVHPVPTKWWYGWGIRLTPKGWLYSVSGLEAVAVTRTNGRTTLIGTDDPLGLANVLMGLDNHDAAEGSHRPHLRADGGS